MTNTLYMICNIDNFTLFTRVRYRLIKNTYHSDGIEKSIDEKRKRLSNFASVIHEGLDLFSAEHGLIACTCANDS